MLASKSLAVYSHGAPAQDVRCEVSLYCLEPTLAPAQAARYQVVAMLLAAAGAALASSAAVLAAVNAIVDGDHQVRGERLAQRAPGSAGVAGWVQAQCGKVWAFRVCDLGLQDQRAPGTAGVAGGVQAQCGKVCRFCVPAWFPYMIIFCLTALWACCSDASCLLTAPVTPAAC